MECHVVGAVALQGHMAEQGWHSLVWMGTTIGDERRHTTRYRSPARRVLHRATLPALERIEIAVLRNAAKVMTHSRHTARCVRELGIPSEKIEAVPVPIDTQRFRPSTESIDTRQGVLFVGRTFDPRKRFDRVLRLLEDSRIVAEAGVDVVSPGSPFREWDVTGLRWRGRIVDLVPMFQSAKILVLPSAQEGLGIVVFEAMASGTPVVAFSCGGPDEYIVESGGGFVVSSYEDFRRKAELLLTDESIREDMSARGRDWVNRNMAADLFLSNGEIFRSNR